MRWDEQVRRGEKRRDHADKRGEMESREQRATTTEAFAGQRTSSSIEYAHQPVSITPRIINTNENLEVLSFIAGRCAS